MFIQHSSLFSDFLLHEHEVKWDFQALYAHCEWRSGKLGEKVGAKKKKKLMSVRLRWVLQSHKFKINRTQFGKAVEIIDRTPTPHNTGYE